MCGLIGIASNKPVSTNIINSLKKLEYRGYDSAGLATLANDAINEKFDTTSMSNFYKLSCLRNHPYAPSELRLAHARQ